MMDWNCQTVVSAGFPLKPQSSLLATEQVQDFGLGLLSNGNEGGWARQGPDILFFTLIFMLPLYRLAKTNNL